jgi:hypothetical protein
MNLPARRRDKYRSDRRRYFRRVGQFWGELAMRKFSLLALVAGAGLSALIAATGPVSAQSAADTCQANRDACDAQCGPIATGSPWNGASGFEVHPEAIECRGQCKRTYDFCMRRASIMSNPPNVAVQGDRPSGPRGLLGGANILGNGPGFSTQGPSATGTPLGGGTAAPAGKIY